MYYGSGDTTAEKTVTFTYDATGNLTGYDDGVTSAAYAYDVLYQKTSETVNYGPFAKTNAYAYYPNGLKESFTGPDGAAVAYNYDAGVTSSPAHRYRALGRSRWVIIIGTGRQS